MQYKSTKNLHDCLNLLQSFDSTRLQRELTLIKQPERELTLIHKHYDLLEGFEKVHILITELLHLEHEGQLRFAGTSGDFQQGTVLLQMFQRLLCDQILLLVPLHSCHDGVPDLQMQKIYNSTFVLIHRYHQFIMSDTFILH